LNKKIRL